MSTQIVAHEASSSSPVSSSTAAYTYNGELIDAANFYAIACDPNRSVAIEACAGAGKTWMLVSRILRALLAGAKPQSILAITYTKKAAGEMRERLQEWLYTFACEKQDSKLIEELVNRGIAKKDAPALLPKLRELYAHLLKQPLSVEIRTFHSWFAQLLSAAPLGVLNELELPIQYNLLEDDSELFYPSWYALLNECIQNTELKADLQALIEEQGEPNTREALRGAWTRRIEFALADEHQIVQNSVKNAPDPRAGIIDAAFEKRWLGYAQALGQQKNKTPQKAATDIEMAITFANPDDRLALLRQALFVKAGDRLSKNLQKFEAAQNAEIELVEILGALKQHLAYIHQQRMLRLTRALLHCYKQVKHEQGVIDMSDLERIALRLLGDTETYGWVAERLDARISQVLIDEFQDTNPMQWQALKGWLSAYAGAGGGGRLNVFIVGDPKQSIYRFRRADPEVFSAACTFLKDSFGGCKLACDHTRRNAPEVIHIVNEILGAAQQAGEFDGFRPHTTAVQTAHSGTAHDSNDGMVGRLPFILRENMASKASGKADAKPLWRDSLTQPRYFEEEKLRVQEVRQVADLIEMWILQDKWKPSDIKVLARKKERLRELLSELNQRQVPWRFADDINLIDTQEVQDIAALLDVLVSPLNDLSLAQVLRSPIFGLDDEALMVLYGQVKLARQARLAMLGKAKASSLEEQEETTADDHQGNTSSSDGAVSWWNVLQEAQEIQEKANDVQYGAADHAFIWPESLKEAAQKLSDWKALAQSLPPHDLLDAIYSQGAILSRYAKAVPKAMRSEVLANLSALLQQSLTLDSGRFATPYNFVRVLRKKGIKSEYPKGDDAVELLTIHGAKGLEARGIILLDTDPQATREERLSVLMSWPAQQSTPDQFVFYISKKKLSDDVQALADKEAAADEREELNALYVAMTRARERLVFSALESRSVNPNSWWRRLDAIDAVESEQDIDNAQYTTTTPAKIINTEPCHAASSSVLKTAIAHMDIATGTETETEAVTIDVVTDKLAETFKQKELPVYQALPSTIAQNEQIFELIKAETGLAGVSRQQSAGLSSPTQDSETLKQRFGRAVHRLLELESTEAIHVQSIVQEMALTSQQTADAVAMVQTILTHPQSGRFFASEHITQAFNEVELLHEGQVLRIDRLVQMNGQWWVLDYKSASQPLEARAEEYQKQLSSYKEALIKIYPDAVIHTALISGNGEVIEV